MKKGIHPEYYPEAVVRCACGNELRVGATRPEIRVEVCSKCHPFFTGEQRFVDTEGRVEKFMKKYADYYREKESR
ncbi:50S ribosomal protein L31 [Thermosulfurimonas sp. F29]|uniref:50S ribosomal protein L31 n=1 Tax=Thermosulfurimonas sp. F29 TaxID=2867247 RepID=UPI001C829848|nr:50S ribosomal protein L31 [Thermosulfurimonas sp. F29]MBX6422423.1 50S ribosomal protein L31 [Thermosulfurimonas sp. F29]